jgi:mannose-6-phosphate isomerase-like protein (cupin superfamily)
MSFPTGPVTVRRATEPWEVPGPPSVRFVAPGSATAGRYGLFEYAMAPRAAGPGPHYHRTFSESFYVLSGTLTIHDGSSWTRSGRVTTCTSPRAACTPSATTETTRCRS